MFLPCLGPLIEVMAERIYNLYGNFLFNAEREGTKLPKTHILSLPYRSESATTGSTVP